jgi:hypothetical protein
MAHGAANMVNKHINPARRMAGGEAGKYRSTVGARMAVRLVTYVKENADAVSLSRTGTPSYIVERS